jgi:hypothetical protein
MIAIAFALAYPEGFGLEPYDIAFPLWEGYECRTPAEAHEFALWLLAGPQPAEVLDHEGEVWEFCRETVRAVMV